jgi:hypothetical protein
VRRGCRYHFRKFDFEFDLGGPFVTDADICPFEVAVGSLLISPWWEAKDLDAACREFADALGGWNGIGATSGTSGFGGRFWFHHHFGRHYPREPHNPWQANRRFMDETACSFELIAHEWVVAYMTELMPPPPNFDPDPQPRGLS